MKNIKNFLNFDKEKNIFDYIYNEDMKSIKKYIDSGQDINIKN